MPVVWALRGFVSICNVQRLFELVIVTDRDKPVKRRPNVSICNIRGPNNPVPVIDREISLVPLGWDCNVFRPPHPLFLPLTDASAAIQRD